ncbi:MAG: hypothetical protein IKU07_07685 [Oscillospiraceae bacterium]|nr:hypothetical protein [Oscillospiraceae bacterium]
MKRFLSLFIAIIMVLSMIPAVSFAAEVRTVYWDPVNGSDSNMGLLESAPVLTVEAAYAALSGADEGKIIMLGTTNYTESTYFPTCHIPVTITSKTGAEGIKSAKSIFFGGDTTLENITMTLNASNNTTYLSGEGHNLTIGSNVTTKNSSTYRFCLTLRHGEGSMDGATLTVNSGNWRSIFVAGYTKATSGSCTLIMNGGNVNNIVGPTYSGTVTGNVTMHINGGTINVLDPGPNTTGSLFGNVDMTLRGGTITKARIQSARPISGTVTVTIDGDCTGIKAFEAKTGSVGKKVLVLKSGILSTMPTNTGDISVEIPQNQTFLMNGITVAAGTVNSAGILQFAGSASLTASQITGTLNCDVTDTVLVDHIYLKAPAGSSVIFAGDDCVAEANGLWKYSDTTAPQFDTVNFKGLVLTTTADDVVIEFYKYFSTKEEYRQTPVYVDGKDQYYAVAANTRYRYVAKPISGNNRYIIHQNVYITAEEAAQKTVIDVTPGVRTTKGWDTPEAVNNFTDEVMTTARKSDPSLWPQYSEIFTSPAFREGRNDHQQTTQTEMENYLSALDDPDDNIYVYTLGKTAVGSLNIPLVVITSADLSGAKDWEEAAALIRADSEKNNKVTVHYQAQIHGNEPAAGEAAFGMIARLDGAYGETLLDNLNIYVIPRLNPYGAYKSKRVTWINSSTYTDPNRDFLHLQTSEVQARMRAFNAFDPEIVFDNHEYQFNLDNTSTNRTDMMYCCHPLPTASTAYQDLAVDITHASFAQMEADGLSYSWYDSGSGGGLGSLGGNTGSSNTAARGTIHILMETMGSNYGLNMYARRVVSHASAVTGILNYLNENADRVKSVIKAEREMMIENGKTYREDDVFAMQTASEDAPQHYIEGEKINLMTGETTPVTITAKRVTTITRSRIAPTAYVLPADLSNIDYILNLMDMQGIYYTFIPAGATLPLQQYIGTVTAADLAEEKTVTFRNGAYVFTMAQVDAQILGMLMEVDVNYTASEKGSLAQQGLIEAVNGAFPTYRYIRDLNEDVFVDYTIVEYPPLEVTVYLDSTNGADTNSGLTETAAVKTLEQAYALINAALADGGKGSNATIVVLGMYELGSATYHFPACDFPVTITAKTTEEGISFTGSSGDAHLNRAVHLHGATTFQNIKLHVNNSENYSYIFANGHKLVIGANVNSTANKNNCNFSISGGSVSYGDKVDSVDVTVRSGKWRMIYLGGYYGDVTGVAKLDISGATIVYSIVSSYRGNVGSLEMYISDTTVSTTSDKAHGIFSGTYTANSTVNSGKVLGDVTIVLGENVTAYAVYGTARSYGHVYGDTTIIANGVDLAKAPVYARYSGLSASYPTRYVALKLQKDITADVTVDPDLELDLNGHDITGNVTVNGELTVFDSATDDYDVSDGVCGEITGNVTGTLTAKEGYIAAANGFHKFGGHYISSVSLRPGNAGIYYTATFLADEILLAELETGVAVSLVDLPGADFATDEDTLYTTGTTGVLVSNILTGDSEDADRAIMDIYAASYVKLPDGTVSVSDAEIAYSLYDILLILKSQNPEAFQSFATTHNIENWF